MKKSILSLIVAMAFGGFLVACQQELIPETSTKGHVYEEDEDIIFVDHIEDKFKPSTAHPKGQRARGLSDGDLAPSDQALTYLGYAYYPHAMGGQESENLKTRILDVKSILEDPQLRGTIQSQHVGETYHLIITGEDQNYIMRTRYKQRVHKADLSVNLLGLLKIGGNYKRDLINYTVTSEHRSEGYGSLEILFKKRKSSMQLSYSSLARIIENYLYPSFRVELFTSSIGEVADLVGPYVLTSYSTGGSILAQYKVQYDDYYHSDSINKFVDAGIKASFDIGNNSTGNGTGDKDKGGSSLKGDAGIDYTFQYHRTKGNTEAKKKFISWRYMQSTGGDQAAWRVTPIERGEVPIDCSTWLSSLKDESTHAIVGVEDQGLQGIEQFILETNYKRRLIDIYKQVLPQIKQEKEPSLRIAKVYVRDDSKGEPLYDVVTILNTRNDDYIMLTPIRYNASDDELAKYKDVSAFKARAKELAREIKPIIALGKPKASLVEVLRPYLREQLCVEFPFTLTPSDHVFRYRNPNNQTWYVYDTKKKLAFSFLDINALTSGTTNLDVLYKMDVWIHKLPIREISMLELLKKYTVVGL